MNGCRIKKWMEQKIQLKMNSLLSNRSFCSDGNFCICPVWCGCHRHVWLCSCWNVAGVTGELNFPFYLISSNLNLVHHVWLVSSTLDGYDPHWVMVNGWSCPLLNSSSPNRGFLEKGHLYSVFWYILCKHQRVKCSRLNWAFDFSKKLWN